MRNRWIAPLAAIMVAAATLAQAETGNETPPQSQAQNRSKADAPFIEKALKSGRETVELAKLAAERSRNDQVKQFAEMVASDYVAVNEQLVLLSQRDGAAPAPRDGTNRSDEEKSASPPAATPGAAPTSPKAQELSKLTGMQFDQQFMAAMVDGQEKSAELYAEEAERGSDPAAQKLATEALPRIKSYLDQAKSIRVRLTDKENR